jgi:hypothetical protein
MVALVGVISTETFQAVFSQRETANPIAEDQNAANQVEQQSKTQRKCQGELMLLDAPFILLQYLRKTIATVRDSLNNFPSFVAITL